MVMLYSLKYGFDVLHRAHTTHHRWTERKESWANNHALIGEPEFDYTLELIFLLVMKDRETPFFAGILYTLCRI